jgi:hypothetical protein
MARKAGSGGVSARVREIRSRITQWRRTREKRSPMSAELWGAAVALARTEGTYPIARALRVDYASLARRVAETQSGNDAGVTAGGSSGFVELSGAQILDASMPVGPILEICNRDGLRLTVRLAAGEKVDVAALLHGLCRRGA